MSLDLLIHSGVINKTILTKFSLSQSIYLYERTEKVIRRSAPPDSVPTMAEFPEVEHNDLSIQQADGKTSASNAATHIKGTLTVKHHEQLDHHLARPK